MPSLRVLVLAAKRSQGLLLGGRRIVDRVLEQARKISKGAKLVERVPAGLKGELLLVDGLMPFMRPHHWRDLLAQARSQKLPAASLDDGCGQEDCRDGEAMWYFCDGREAAGTPAQAFEKKMQQGSARLLNIQGHYADSLSSEYPDGQRNVEKAFRERQVWRIEYAGAVVLDPETTYIDESVKVGKGSVIAPMCILSGATVIGKNCQIGPMARIKDSRIEDGAVVDQSILDGARVGQKAVIGPWARLRPGSVIGKGAKVGNFVEIKNSVLGADARANHLSYVGDASVGAGANIGAGVITANYDGKNKYRTHVGKKAFIGSGTVLVAPVSVGEGAMTGAGAVVLKGHHVPARGVVAGVPARPLGLKKKSRG